MNYKAINISKKKKVNNDLNTKYFSRLSVPRYKLLK